MITDINQMYYLKKIVESDYNLTEASRKIHISQPALSQYISNLEDTNNIKIFERKNKRLVGLTPVGEIIYDSTLNILKQYEDMNELVLQQIQGVKKNISFGATASYPQILLPDFFTYLAVNCKNVNINLEEGGAVAIKERFLNSEFDFALLVEPTNIPESFATSYPVYKDELVAYLSEKHPLSQKDKISWEEMAEYPIITLNQEFVTYYKVKKAFDIRNLKPNYVFFSSSWQYLMNSINNDANIITILPQTTPKFTDKKKTVYKKIIEPEVLSLVLAKKKEKTESAELRIIDKLLKKTLLK